jgi:putative alpha-1,2-mannosidase
MIGNDDCGQMSAWYIFSTLGFYPVNPANGTFVFGSPQVASARINLGDGLTFSIKADNYSESAIYNTYRRLDGEELIIPYLTYDDIAGGGELIFEMTTE